MNKLILLISVLVFVLCACGAPASPPPPPTEAVAPPPSQTMPPPASQTPPPPTPTLEPSATLDPLLFRDDFEGSLGKGWHWQREKAKYWSLTEKAGWLQIMARPGMLRDNTITNVLLRAAPAGNFEIETRIHFMPGGNYQSAGVIMYDDEGWVSLIRASCDGPTCVGDGFYLDKFTGGNYAGNNFATKAPAGEEFYLRLRRQGDTYTGSISLNGTQWTVLGGHQRGPWPLVTGILAGQAWSTVPKAAQFDYFVVNAVP